MSPSSPLLVGGSGQAPQALEDKQTDKRGYGSPPSPIGHPSKLPTIVAGCAPVSSAAHAKDFDQKFILNECLKCCFLRNK